jgi:hypothetical protein
MNETDDHAHVRRRGLLWENASEDGEGESPEGVAVRIRVRHTGVKARIRLRSGAGGRRTPIGRRKSVLLRSTSATALRQPSRSPR